jgi:hypothetical protein
MTTQDMNAALRQLTRRGLAHADRADVVMFAKQLWYSSSVPDLNTVPKAQRNDAGYVVDCLARFNVLQKERKTLLIKVVDQFKPLKDQPRTVKNVDRLANDWNASGDLMKFMSDLLPLQTRTYVSELQAA